MAVWDLGRAAARMPVAPARGPLGDLLRDVSTSGVASGITDAAVHRLRGDARRCAALVRAKLGASDAALGGELLRSIEIRPTEVARAAFAYGPRFGTLGPSEVRRGRELVERALAGLDPVIVVNRYPETARALLAGEDAWLATRPRTRSTSVVDGARLEARRGWELLLGKHGSGETAGRTVYGTVQFVPRHADGAAGALSDLAAARSGFGARRYGSTVLELTPGALLRSTFTARDSGLSRDPSFPAPIERMADVVLERLSRTHTMQPDLQLAGGDGSRVGLFGRSSPVELKSQFDRLLHGMTDEDASTLIADYLTSSALLDMDHYVEAQVRGVSRDLVAAVHEEPPLLPDAIASIIG